MSVCVYSIKSLVQQSYGVGTAVRPSHVDSEDGINTYVRNVDRTTGIDSAKTKEHTRHHVSHARQQRIKYEILNHKIYVRLKFEILMSFRDV